MKLNIDSEQQFFENENKNEEIPLLPLDQQKDYEDFLRLQEQQSENLYRAITDFLSNSANLVIGTDKMLLELTYLKGKTFSGRTIEQSEKPFYIATIILGYTYRLLILASFIPQDEDYKVIERALSGTALTVSYIPIVLPIIIDKLLAVHEKVKQSATKNNNVKILNILQQTDELIRTTKKLLKST